MKCLPLRLRHSLFHSTPIIGTSLAIFLLNSVRTRFHIMEIFPRYRNHVFLELGMSLVPSQLLVWKTRRETICRNQTNQHDHILRTLTGAYKSPSTITAYQTRTDETLRVVTK
jgi:hypothetical protein